MSPLVVLVLVVGSVAVVETLAGVPAIAARLRTGPTIGSPWRTALWSAAGRALIGRVVVLGAATGAALGAGGDTTGVAVAITPLLAAPLTAAPLLGAPIRIALLVAVAAGLGDPVVVLAAAVVATVVSAVLGARPARAGARVCRDTVAVLVATPVVLGVGVVPLLVGLPLVAFDLCRAPVSTPTSIRACGPTGRPTVVLLDGVGKTWLAPTRVARSFGAALLASRADLRLVTDVLPYAPSGVPLADRPRTGRWWRLLRRRAFPMLVAHNVLQSVLLCDERYRDACGQAVGAAIVGAMDRAGHGRGDPVLLVGYSGAAAVALAAVDTVHAVCGDPAPTVVGIGGFHDGRRLPVHGRAHMLVGDRDAVERLGRAMFVARWRGAGSPWGRATLAGRVVEHRLPGLRHLGEHGYLGASHREATAASVVTVLDDGGDAATTGSPEPCT